MATLGYNVPCSNFKNNINITTIPGLFPLARDPLTVPGKKNLPEKEFH